MNLNDFIFVFGSNLAGRHGRGAARYAVLNRGAIYGVGEGPMGQSYGIPTKDENLCVWSLKDIKISVEHFIGYATLYQGTSFQVTQIGCGLAGYKAKEIAPMFACAPPNCWFDAAWSVYLPGKPIYTNELF